VQDATLGSTPDYSLDEFMVSMITRKRRRRLQEVANLSQPSESRALSPNRHLRQPYHNKRRLHRHHHRRPDRQRSNGGSRVRVEPPQLNIRSQQLRRRKNQSPATSSTTDTTRRCYSKSQSYYAPAGNCKWQATDSFLGERIRDLVNGGTGEDYVTDDDGPL